MARIKSGDPPPEGYWLRAEQQSGGRGRFRRQWVSPPGNLYCSTVVHCHTGDPPPHSLAFVASLAAYEAVCAYADADRLMLKWPNDLLLDGAKLSGILAERAKDQVVVGIGINLASAPDLPDRATAALADAVAEAPDPADCLNRLADCFARRLLAWRKAPLDQLLADWQQRAHTVDTPLAATDEDGMAVQGRFAGLSGDGGLQLRLADGSLTTLHSGDISVA